MPNIRVPQAMDRIEREMKRVFEHVKHHSGISEKDAVIVEYGAKDIAKMANEIAAIAKAANKPRKIRSSRGNKRRSR
jgi:hypothetical protein